MITINVTIKFQEVAMLIFGLVALYLAWKFLNG